MIESESMVLLAAKAMVLITKRYSVLMGVLAIVMHRE